MSNELNVLTGRAALLEHLAVCRIANTPVVVESLPGLGKTEITESLVAEQSAHITPVGFDETKVADTGTKVVAIRIGRHEEYDFPGIPWAKDEGMTVHLHPLLNQLSYGDVCLLDEFKLRGANKFAMQFLEGTRPTCGDWVGPEHVFRVALANGSDAGALECVESPVLGSRTSQVVWTGPTANEWVEYALETKHNPIIVTAIKMEGDRLLKDYQANRMRNSTPRTFTMAARAMDALESYMKAQGKEPSHEQRTTLLASFLNDSAAVNVSAIFHLRDKLVPFSVIVNQPTTAPLPDNPAGMMMVASNIANKTTPENFSDVMRYVLRLDVEYQGAVVDPLLKRHPQLAADQLAQDYLQRTSNLRRS